nr:transposase [Wolbachia endosymbiont of Bemisia tabaci]
MADSRINVTFSHETSGCLADLAKATKKPVQELAEKLIRRAIDEVEDIKVLYLPTYSPDLNPIEHYWFKIKHNIRKISHMFTDFSDAVCFILKNVSTFVY